MSAAETKELAIKLLDCWTNVVAYSEVSLGRRVVVSYIFLGAGLRSWEGESNDPRNLHME